MVAAVVAVQGVAACEAADGVTVCLAVILAAWVEVE